MNTDGQVYQGDASSRLDLKEDIKDLGEDFVPENGNANNFSVIGPDNLPEDQTADKKRSRDELVLPPLSSGRNHLKIEDLDKKSHKRSLEAAQLEKDLGKDFSPPVVRERQSSTQLKRGQFLLYFRS